MTKTNSRTSSRPHLAKVGRAEAQRALGETAARIRTAQKDIEAEIEKHDGLYPANGGVLNLQEVLRRASLSKSALEKPRHAETKRALQIWIKAVIENKARGHKAVRKVVTAKVEDANEQVRQIREQWHLAELEHNETLNELEKARARIAELEAQIEELRVELAGGKVVPLNRKGKR